MSTVYLPKPHVNQRPIVDSTARFKLVRAGRRFGKDRLAMHAAVAGHGEGRWKGVMQGVNVAWVGPDYPQIRAIWREEVEPRFQAVEGMHLRRQERSLTLQGLGTLEFRSAENIDSLRGMKLGGAVLNEAAFFNLEYALREVILPALIDLGGWVIIISTPNAGNDGYESEEGKRTPSYFNILCERAADGTLGPGWRHWHFTSRDNPKIPAHEVEALYAEYHPDSPERQQELDARLIVAGAGVAFPEWSEAVHVARYSPEDPAHRHLFRWAAGGDWGYSKPGGLWLVATGSERSLVRHEFYFTKRTAYDVGYSWGKMIQRFPRPEWIAIDTPPVSDGGPTILEQLQAGMNDAVRTGSDRGSRRRPLGKNPPVFLNPPKGPGSRQTKKIELHKLLKWSADESGTVNPWDMPQLQIHPDCVNLIRTLPRLPRDPKKPEDVDSTAEDHCLAGDTLVFTDAGWVPISEVAGARITGYDAETLSLSLPTGNLVCTPNHRILTPDGWTEAQYLKRGQPILWWCPQRSRRLPVGITTSAATTSSARGARMDGGQWSDSTGSCGRLTTGPFLTPTTFTTSITIDPITGLSTFGVGLRASTSLIIPAGIGSLTDNGQPDELTPADHAERVIAVCLAKSALTRLGEVTKRGRLSTVYDVGVAHGFHGFVAAGGVIVHNCYDGICAWAMARIPYVDRPHPNGHHPDDHPGFEKRYELEPAEIGEGEVKWSRLPPGYEEDMGW